MKKLFYKGIALPLLFFVSQGSFAQATYSVATGELNIPKVRIAPEQGEPSCYRVKMQANDKNAPTHFTLKDSQEIPRGLTEDYGKSAIVGDSVWLSKTTSQEVDLFDLKLLTFTTAARLPEQLDDSFGIGVDGDSLYLVGGRLATTNDLNARPYLKTVWRYDKPQNTWSALAEPLPFPVLNPDVVVAGNKLYVAGRYADGNANNTKIQIYDLSTQRWSTMPAKVAAEFANYARPGDYYRYGEQLLYKEADQLYVYQFSHQQWQSFGKTPGAGDGMLLVPAARSGFAYLIYYLDSNQLWVFNQYTQQWDSPSSYPTYFPGGSYLFMTDTGDLRFFYLTPDKLELQSIVTLPHGNTFWHTYYSLMKTSLDCPADAVYAPELGLAHIPVVNVSIPKQADLRVQANLQHITGNEFSLKFPVNSIAAYQPHIIPTQTQVVSNENALYLVGTGSINRYDVNTLNWQRFDNNTLYAESLFSMNLLYSFPLQFYQDIHQPAVEWDPSKNTQRIIPTLPASRTSVILASLDGQIYALGGSKRENKYTTSVHKDTFIYNPAQNAWSTGINLPDCTNGGAAAALDHKLYHSGGYTFESKDYCGVANGFPMGRLADTLIRFDPQKSVWEKLASMPEALANHQMLAWQGELFVFGIHKSWRYDPIQNQWRIADIPIEQLGPDARFQIVNNELYAVQFYKIADGIQQKYLAVWRYNPIQNRWEQLTDAVETQKPSNSIHYQAHVQNEGWQDWRQNGTPIGTTHANQSLEAVRILWTDNPNCSISYRVKVKEQGWTLWRNNGATAGTTGLSLPLENLQINGVDCNAYRLKYRVSLQNRAWQDWKSSGDDYAVDFSNQIPIEALEIGLEKLQD